MNCLHVYDLFLGVLNHDAGSLHIVASLPLSHGSSFDIMDPAMKNKGPKRLFRDLSGMKSYPVVWGLFS